MIKIIDALSSGKRISQVKELYMEAFPPEERIPFFFIKKKAKTKDADIFSVYDDGKFIGIVHCVYYLDIVYIYYLAIKKSERANGYGTKLLRALSHKFADKRITLNIEVITQDCDNRELRVKRKEFYMKNGYKECGYYVKEKDVPFEMLYCGRYVCMEEYEELIANYFGKFLFKRYYKRVSDDGVSETNINCTDTSISK